MSPPSPLNYSKSHRRRTSNLVSPATEEKYLFATRTSKQGSTGAASALEGAPAGVGYAAHSPLLPTIPGTPKRMSLDRSPSPQANGGWSSPGLTTARGNRRTPSPRAQFDVNAEATWRASSSRSEGFAPRRGWMPGGLKSLSISLPRFDNSHTGSKNYGEKEKVNRGRIPRSTWERAQMLVAVLKRAAWRLRAQLLLLVGIAALVALFYATPAHRLWRRTSFLGGGNKFVVILAANQGGGVMEWKGPREWAIERDSVKNKKKYAARHGYYLEIVDMATKKRYAHEWRESWEKVDTIRRCLREYPSAEWFWWLDLNTFIMEPSYSLQKHIFADLANNVYRDINEWNPLNITHPPDLPYLDDVSQSPTGDGDPNSINMLVPQDCSGFNLGSFFMRRSQWTDRLLDIWWDPVHYEQRHMQWEHKEQDAFENLYISQPWIRPHTAFLYQRKANSFPPGACGENNKSIHYDEKERDFVVNMAGCEWGRDCWGEIYHYRELSNYLNRTVWQRLRDAFRDTYKKLAGKEKEKEDGNKSDGERSD